MIVRSNKQIDGSNIQRWHGSVKHGRYALIFQINSEKKKKVFTLIQITTIDTPRYDLMWLDNAIEKEVMGP